jgi:hypothetical protein
LEEPMTAPAKTDRQVVRDALICTFCFGLVGGTSFFLGLYDILLQDRMIGWGELMMLPLVIGCFAVSFRRALQRFP